MALGAGGSRGREREVHSKCGPRIRRRDPYAAGDTQVAKYQPLLSGTDQETPGQLLPECFYKVLRVWPEQRCRPLGKAQKRQASSQTRRAGERQGKTESTMPHAKATRPRHGAFNPTQGQKHLSPIEPQTPPTACTVEATRWAAREIIAIMTRGPPSVVSARAHTDTDRHTHTHTHQAIWQGRGEQVLWRELKRVLLSLPLECILYYCY